MRRSLPNVVAKPKRPPLLPDFEIWEELGRMEDDRGIGTIEQLRSTESTGSDFCFLKACHEAVATLKRQSAAEARSLPTRLLHDCHLWQIMLYGTGLAQLPYTSSLFWPISGSLRQTLTLTGFAPLRSFAEGRPARTPADKQ